MNTTLRLPAFALLASLTCVAGAAERTMPCEQCAAWNEPQKPFKLYGNAYYVGTHRLASILVTSDKGHVIIDAALPESVDQIAANVRALGFRVEDIKTILNTHAHFDHAGGLARLQRLTGAKVWASPWSAKAFANGITADDPQFGVIEPIEKIANVSVLKDGDTVRVGPLSLVAHFTPGHTGGGTSWTWKSCEGERCLNMVYADSLTAVSAPNFRFTGKPDLLEQFDRAFAAVSALPCDILVTPHPEASGLWERLAKPDGLVDATACGRYADAARERLRKRLADEGAK
jgi:metallo-beta-lactamase class B